MILLSAAAAIAQNNYYVTPTGSDSNSCSKASPCATINHAGSLTVAGDTVHVAAGTYNNSVRIPNAGTSTNCSLGNTASCITYVCDVKWSCKIPPVVTINQSYVVFKWFEIDGTLSGNVCCGIDGTGATGDQIIGNKIHDTASAGNTTSNCVICLDAGAVGGGHHIYDGNFLYHNNGGASGSTPNNSGQHGIYSEMDHDIVQNNIVMDQGGGWCIHSWHKVSNWTVVNNTVANCPNGGIVLGDDSSTGVVHNNDIITNNIVVNSGNATTANGGIDFRACGTNDVVQNNLMYGNIPSNYVGGCSGTTLGGTQTGSNSTTFINYTGTSAGDYHLKAASTAIATGTTTCASGVSQCVPITDFDGNSRSSPWDIGAFVLSTGAGGALNPPIGLTATVQ
jgi:hypothetical protein